MAEVEAELHPELHQVEGELHPDNVVRVHLLLLLGTPCLKLGTQGPRHPPPIHQLEFSPPRPSHHIQLPSASRPVSVQEVEAHHQAEDQDQEDREDQEDQEDRDQDREADQDTG